MAVNPFAFTPAEIAQVEQDAANIIKAAGTTAEVWRAAREGQGSFGGPYEGDMTSVGAFSVEFVTDPAATVLEEDSDGLANALPDDDIRKFDRIVIEGRNYRVRHVRPHNPFGARTFNRLELKREYP